MRTFLGFLLFYCLPGPASGQDIFLSTLNGLLFSLDLADCDYQQIGVMPVSSTDISFHPNGNLYAVTGGGDLYEVDPLTASSTYLHSFEPGATQLYTALTISAEGIFYACGLGGDLWAYDLVTDAGTYLGNVGTGAEGDLTFYDGNLYMAAEDDNIVLVDIDDPANSSIAVNGNVPGRIFGVVSFAESCEEISVYALTDNAANVYEVDFTTGSLNFYCSIPLEVSGGASTFEFLGSDPVYIDEVLLEGFNCEQADGMISVTASGGVGALTYSLDGVEYQSAPEFTGLSVATYTVYVADEVGCIRTQEITPDADLPVFNEVRITNTTCEADNGRIEVVVSGGLPPYAFYVNGTLVPGLLVTDLTEGNYQLEVIDAAGCSATSQANIGGAALPTIANTTLIGTSCGENNGSLTFTVAGGVEPFAFSLNGGPSQNVGQFTGLPAGEYTLLLEDQAGCTATATETILPSSQLSISGLTITDARCGEAVGTLAVQTNGGQPPLAYTLNGVTGLSPDFAELPAGEYLLNVSDAAGCVLDTVLTVGDTPPVSLSVTARRDAECLAADGAVTLAFGGGTGPLSLSENGRSVPLLTEVTDLAAGEYRYVLTDSLGCAAAVDVTIFAGDCPLYLPNAFSPNGDGVNDYFAPQSVADSGTTLLGMRVYDRWGGLVFIAGAGAPNDLQYRWDGTRAGRELPFGVYAYFLEVQGRSGAVEVIAGDVLLLR